MKACFVCSEYPPSLHGGIGTYTRVLGRALRRRGHEVRVIGVYPHGQDEPVQQDDEGVQVWRLAEPAARGGWLAGRYRLFEMVRRWSRDGEIDFVEVPDYAGWSAGWSRLRVPVISRLHGAATYFAAETGGTVRPLTRWLENRSLHRADFVCSVSRYTARRTEALFRLSSGVDTVLYNPVELPPASEWSARASNRVVFTGTLTAKKGVVELVRAWPRVLERCPDAELHMYGKDTTLENGESMMARLKGALGGRGAAVVWHGHVPREELLAALATARAAVFPSHSESLGIAPLEAMATGCPTVFSERGPGPEVAEHGREILLVNPASEKAIADALLKLLTSDELAARIGAAGRARVAAGFSLDKLVAENEAFFRRCVGA
jgi:glycosyltransferase involved in cell wall biosynthesis